MSHLQKIYFTLKHCSSHDRTLIVKMVCWLVIVRLIRLCLPFRVLAQGLGETGKKKAVSLTPAQQNVLERNVTVLNKICRLGWWHPTCLEQAWAISQALKRHDLAVTVYIGVRYRPFKAHAWSRCGDASLTGCHEAPLFQVITFYTQGVNQ